MRKMVSWYTYITACWQSQNLFIFSICASKITLFLFWLANVSAQFFGKSPYGKNTYMWEVLLAKLSRITGCCQNMNQTIKAVLGKGFGRQISGVSRFLEIAMRQWTEQRLLLKKMLSQCECTWLFLSQINQCLENCLQLGKWLCSSNVALFWKSECAGSDHSQRVQQTPNLLDRKRPLPVFELLFVLI